MKLPNSEDMLPKRIGLVILVPIWMRCIEYKKSRRELCPELSRLFHDVSDGQARCVVDPPASPIIASEEDHERCFDDWWLGKLKVSIGPLQSQTMGSKSLVQDVIFPNTTLSVEAIAVAPVATTVRCRSIT